MRYGDIYLITGNLDKLKEAERILGRVIKNVKIDLDELQGLDCNKISEHKVLQAWEKVKKPLFVWDQSLYISCLNGFPGPLIKWFWMTVTLDKICQIAHFFGDTKIKASTTLTFYNGKGIRHFTGEARGTIPKKPLGDGGFGWDPIFIPDGSDQTYAQMSPQDKLFHTMNNDAFAKLSKYLKL